MSMEIRELTADLAELRADDTEAMIDAASKCKNAVVIGGGLLGLEAANGLMRRGMNVTVVHVMPTLMERQLDEVAGKLLQQSLAEPTGQLLCVEGPIGSGKSFLLERLAETVPTPSITIRASAGRRYSGSTAAW